MTRRADGLYQEVIKVNGKKKYFYGRTKAEVLRKIQEYQGEVERGRLFKDVAEEWWEEHEKDVVPSTMHGYKARFKCAIETFGEKAIKNIATSEISSLLKSLQKKDYGKKVILTQLNVLNMIFSHALNKDIDINPCSAAELPKGLKKRKRELPTDAELEIVKNSDWLFPFFLLYTGCRRGEAIALTYEDIDWNRKIIHINKSVGYRGNEPYIKSPKTEAGYRDIILLDKLAERIPKNKHGLIFPDGEGKIYHESVLTRKWQRWARDNNVSCTPHQLRHGYATLLFEAGIEVKDAQYLLGHSTVSMTQDVYTHIRNSRHIATAQKLNEYISK